MQAHAFAIGIIKDNKGRTLKEMQEFSRENWEGIHDFIQWMFPLPYESCFNPNAPILTYWEVEKCSKDWGYQQELIKSTKKYLQFLGFRLYQKGWLNKRWRIDKIKDKSENDFYKNFNELWFPRNHNYLRITRMLQCLVLMGQEEIAQEVWKQLIFVKCCWPNNVGDDTMVYWRNALTGYSY